MCHLSVKSAAESACGRFKTREEIVTKIRETALSEKFKVVGIKNDMYENAHSYSFLRASWCAKYPSESH